MSVPSPNSRVVDLHFELQRNLLAHLDDNGAWQLVAEASGVFSELDVLQLSNSSSPSWNLLVELDNKLCTVELLCRLLEHCQLLNALALLREHEPLAIILQPGQTEEADSSWLVPLGGQLKLECHATGLPPPKYEWFFENSKIPGQCEELLLIDDFQAYNEGNYCCQVSQPDLTLNSRWIHVEVLPQPPKFITQPPAMTICKETQDVTISCEASGYPKPEFQWLYENSYIDHQKSNVLKLDNIEIGQSGCYRCYAKNKAGEVYSSTSEVQVYESSAESSCVEESKRHRAVEKVALLIANDIYQESATLNNPQNDVNTLAEKLRSFGFRVIALRNLNRVEMMNALKMFCSLLHGDDYALFYFAGHGFELHDKYMLPVDAPPSSSYLRRDSLCDKRVIKDVLERKPLLFVILLDMCLTAPEQCENPDIYNEQPEVYVYVPGRNLIQGYATTSNLRAYERSNESNGIYMKHLSHLMLPNVPIGKILDNVGKKVSEDATDVADQQIPSKCSNIVDEFYFNDAVTGHKETKLIFEALMYLPPTARIEFHLVQTFAIAKFYQLGCFQNGLEIRIGNLEKWNAYAENATTALLNLRREHDPNELTVNERVIENVSYMIVTIHNLQKIKTPLTLTISLRDKSSNVLLDNAILNVGLPLIGRAHLWFNKDRV